MNEPMNIDDVRAIVGSQIVRITPENVADAIRIVRPYAVDVASGVEASPGKKDVEKMRRFIDAVRSAP